MNKNFRNLISLVMALFMVLSLTITASAYNPPVQVVTDTVAIKLTDSSEAENFAADAHTYTAVRIFDLVQIMKSNGVDPRLNENNEPMYWYRPASEQMSEMLNDFVARGYYLYDPQSGSIKLSETEEIADMYLINENTSDASLLATRCAQYCAQNGIEGTTLKVGTAITLQCGYYILYETGNSANDGSVATKPILLNIMPSDEPLNITLKDASVFLDKDISGIKEPDKNDKDNDVTVGVGDYVEYTITTRFPVYEHIADSPYSFAPQFTLTDTMCDGLDTTKGYALKVNGSEIGNSTDESYDQAVSYTVTDGTKNAATINFTASNHSITINFVDSYILAHQGEEIEFVYTAKVNDEVKTNYAAGNDNKVELIYSNNPEQSSSVKKLEDEEFVWSYSFNLAKLDGANSQPLAGVVFNMYKDGEKLSFNIKDGVYYPDVEGTTEDITTTSSGKVEIKGLDEGVYVLKEISTLEGYSLIMNDAEVTIEALRDGVTAIPTGKCKVTGSNTGITTNSDSEQSPSKESSDNGETDVNAVIYNYRGVVLPQTGSTTSIILMVVGGIVVVGGIIAFIIILSKKKNDEEDE